MQALALGQAEVGGVEPAQPAVPRGDALQQVGREQRALGPDRLEDLAAHGCTGR